MSRFKSILGNKLGRKNPGGVTWYYDTLTPSIAGFTVVMNEAVEEIIERCAQMVEDYAKENAPWQDRSGEARSGLTAAASSSGFTHTITLFHTAEHGLWLEVRWSGQYAIIQPTIQAMGPVVMAELQGMMGVGV